MFSFYWEWFCQTSRPNCFGESFANVQKKKMTQSSCSFCLELKSENWSWRLHMRVTNLHVSSVCRPSLCVYPLSETIAPSTWAANALVVPTNILLLCYARSCFLQQEISTFWPDSSKYLLCPLRDLFQVYITLYYPYPTLFWSNISPTSLLLWIEKKYWGVTFAQLVFIGIIFCS